MGMSTDGQLCFGICFEDGFEFPWDNEEFDNSIERWWNANKTDNTPPNIELVNYCSCDYPAYILALRDTVVTAWRGRPQTVDIATIMKYSGEEGRRRAEAILFEFCAKAGIELDEDQKPDWYVSSYLG